MTIAHRGSIPFTNRSFTAFTAATRPTTNGSSQNAVNASTLKPRRSPLGSTTTAASSASAIPLSTEASRAAAGKLRRAAWSSSAPTLAAHPPHSISSSAIAPAIGSARSSGPITRNMDMNRRSMRSFRRHAHAARAERPHRRAIAVPSPKFSNARKSRCGAYDESCVPVSRASRFAHNTGPSRTA